MQSFPRSQSNLSKRPLRHCVRLGGS
jgi:hypothetical protein